MSGYDIAILVLLYIVVGVVIFGFLLKKSKTFSPAYKGFVFGMLFYYIIIPIICILNSDTLNLLELAKGKYCTYSVQRFIIDGEYWKKLYAILLLIVSFLIYNISYRFSKIKSCLKIDNGKSLKLIKVFAFATFCIGGLSLVIFLVSFGGIKNALYYAEKLRSFNSDLTEVNSNLNGIFILLAKLITVSPYMFLYLFSKYKSDNKKIYMTLFIVSLTMSIIYFLFNAGRAPLLLFLMSFAYLFVYKKVKCPWLLLLLCAAIGLPILDILDSLFYYFNTGVFNIKDFNYLKLLSQFMFPYKNNLIMTDLIGTYGLRYGSDLITSFIDILPGFGFDASYVNTSEFIVGKNWRELGGIPNDFITFSYLQFSYLGVIIFSFLIGYISKIIDVKLSKFDNNGGKYLFSAAITVDFFALIAYADLVSILKGKFILIALIIIILFSDRREKK